MGCRERRTSTFRYFILDGFDTEFYLLFDASEDPETPEAKGSVDICIARVGEPPPGDNVRVVENANNQGVMRFIFALGAHRFSEKTRKALYASPLR